MEPKEYDPEKFQRCTKCGRLKSMDFYNENTGHCCLDCRRDYGRRYRREHEQELVDYNRIRRNTKIIVPKKKFDHMMHRVFTGEIESFKPIDIKKK